MSQDISICQTFVQSTAYKNAIMSKRLNKRQQREAEELEMLKAEQDRVTTEKAATAADVEIEEEDQDEDEEIEGDAPINAFAAVSHGRPLRGILVLTR
jgi:hypothetical protein